MYYLEACKLLEEDYSESKERKNYLVKMKNGKTKVIRTFFSEQQCRIGIYRKGGRVWGYSIENFNWSDVISLKRKKDYNPDLFKRYKKRLLDAKAMLESSGLWVDILQEINAVIDKGDDVIREIIRTLKEEGSYKFYCECTHEGGKFPFIGTTQVFKSFLHKRCWHSIPFHPFERATQAQRLSEAIKERRRHRYWWRNKYDNRIDVEMGADGKLRGWLACEFLDCANGHYYLLFDDTHAIFYEDD